VKTGTALVIVQDAFTGGFVEQALEFIAFHTISVIDQLRQVKVFVFLTGRPLAFFRFGSFRRSGENAEQDDDGKDGDHHQGWDRQRALHQSRRDNRDQADADDERYRCEDETL
jgi:hypothetical protein